MARTATVTRLPNVAGRKKWAEKITAAWREQLPSIFETGNLLEAAKDELVHGEWYPMINEDLPFKRNVAQRLLIIASNDNLRNGAHAPHLPAVWTILYELTKLTDEQFEIGIKSGAINPKMERKDVNALRGIEPKEKKKKELDDDDPKTLDEWCSKFSLQITRARVRLSDADKKELFEHLQQAINELKRGDDE